MSGGDVIDWLQALKQMGNDAPFLVEVLTDVIVEAKDVLTNIHAAIASSRPDIISTSGIL
jgi:hypothetical protein